MALRLALAFALAASLPAWAQPTPEGYLCCNMRTTGDWISDINYAEAGKKVIPVGTPVKVTGYGRSRAYVEIGDTRQALGNDYSRDLDMGSFVQRYVVAEDLRQKIETFEPRIRQAIQEGKLLPGMTREQVLMSVGYPVSSENPSLDAKMWRFWRGSFEEYRVRFGADGKVSEIAGDPMTRELVVLE